MAVRIVEDQSSIGVDEATVVLESDREISNAFDELDSPDTLRMAIHFAAKNGLGGEVAIRKRGKVYIVNEAGEPLNYVGPVQNGQKLRMRRDINLVRRLV